MTGNETLLEVRDLRVRFRLDKTQTFDAVKGVSFSVPANRTVALVGESGSGKSVSAMAVMGLLPPESAMVLEGSLIYYDGCDLLAMSPMQRRRLRGRGISMIFQEPMTSLNPVFSVGDQIAEVLRVHMGLGVAQAKNRAIELLGEVGIPEPKLRARAYPHQLSGGQQQRVMIAMAIACEPKLLIADEPTTALDVTIQKQILDLLASLKQRHQMSVLFITHDLAMVGEIADDVVVMQGGEIRETGKVADIFERPRHPYTQALLECRPRLDTRPRRLPVIDDFIAAAGKAPRANEIAGELSRGVTPGDPIILEARNLSKDFRLRQGVFGHKLFRAVDNVSFKLAKGKTLGLVGESGSGKTTIGLALMRLIDASEGEVLFEGADLLKLTRSELMPYKRRIQIVFQNPYASLNPRFSIGNILTEPMLIHGIGSGSEDRAQRVYALLDRVGLPRASYNKYPHEFSGGQRQRIAIARCLTMQPDVLICDESVSALDVSIQAQVLNLLQDLQDEFGMSYIFISHDLAVVKYISDQVMVLHDGKLVEMANSDDIYRAPQDEYTRKLLSAIPRGIKAPN
jgi:peptide/nickel transport system ATP-binding protein